MVSDDIQLRFHTHGNPSLERYATAHSAQRKNDLYLWDPLSAYWQSEYSYQGQPAEFRCAFFIHFEPAGDRATKVEIIEYLPIVKLGESSRMAGHSGPGFYDIREVESTVTDRARLLQAIEASARERAG